MTVHHFAVPHVTELPAPAVLWHTCATHRNIGDGPCGPGCRMLCGKPGRPGSTERIALGVTPDHCVVCEELDR